MDNQMVIHTRLTLDEIRVCYYYFFLLNCVYKQIQTKIFLRWNEKEEL